jgi:hypothetical protein
MVRNASYFVRVVPHGAFIWETCRGDGLVVVERSRQSFPTRLEALLDWVKVGAALALEAVQQVPLAFG